MCNALDILGCGNYYILFQVFIDIQVENCTWLEDVMNRVRKIDVSQDNLWTYKKFF